MIETEYEPHTIAPPQETPVEDMQERAQAIIDVLRMRLAQANESLVGAEAEIIILRKRLGLPSGIEE